jgi:hypothetical protein
VQTIRIFRDGHAACAEALRERKGIAAAAVPAAMKQRRLIFTDIDFLPEFFRERSALPGQCHMRRPGQIGALTEIRAGAPTIFRALENIATSERADTAFGGRRRL